MKIPLILTRSVYHESLDLSYTLGFTRVEDYNQHFRYYDQQADGDLIANQYTLSYYRLMKTSKRDIRPKFGQTFFFQYEHTPFGGDYYGEILSLQAQLYFPGLFKHHSLKGRIGLQTQDMSSDADSYRFSSPIPFTRGYVYEPFQTFLTTSTDYALPVWYADLNILSLLNIQRIRANIFHDYGYGIFSKSLLSHAVRYDG